MVLGVINLLVVASFGLLMRLKVLLPLAFVDQKHIMHAHSHFAFSGWISHALMLLLVMVVHDRGRKERLPGRYQLLLFGNGSVKQTVSMAELPPRGAVIQPFFLLQI